VGISAAQLFEALLRLEFAESVVDVISEDHTGTGLFEADIVELHGREHVPFADDDDQIVLHVILTEVKKPAERFHSLRLLQDRFVLTVDRIRDPLVDLLLDLGFSAVHEDDDLLGAVAVQQIVDDLGSAAVPVQDHEVIFDGKLSLSVVRILDNIGNGVGNVTDDRTGEGHHADHDYKKANDCDHHAGLTDIFYYIGNAACVEDHRDRVKCGLEKSHLLGSLQSEGTDDKCRQHKEYDIEDQDRRQYDFSRVFRILDAEPLREVLFYVSSVLILSFHGDRSRKMLLYFKYQVYHKRVIFTIF